MKIKTIMCNSSKEFFEKHSKIRESLATKEVELLVSNIEKGPVSLETSFDEALAGPYILKEVILAEEQGCDAVVLDCAADPVLRAARQVSNLPVVSAGEASHHVALMLSDNFSIITTLDESISMFRENVNKYGYASRVKSIRAINLKVLDLEDEEKTLEALYKEALATIEEDGTECIVLGCTGMLLVRDRLQEKLGIPVVEPLTMGVLLAADLVRSGLKHSLLSYKKPSGHSQKLLRNL